MSLNQDKLAKAVRMYHSYDGGTTESIEAAIETYLEEMFKPGQLVMGEAIPPARDYRKELWIKAYELTDHRGANEALAEFDKTFPKEQP